ncbi:MAG: hypothetical protein ABSC94_06590 [Polyangiaceae bacterium]
MSDASADTGTPPDAQPDSSASDASDAASSDAPEQDAGDGSLSDAGHDGGVCEPYDIAFDLTVDATGPVYYQGPRPWLGSFQCGGWLTISPADQPPLCVLGDCDGGCPALQPQSAMPQSFTWDGTYYVGGTARGCAPAGNYVATICVAYAAGDASSPFESPPTCKQVSFVWPPTSGDASVGESITPTPDGG